MARQTPMTPTPTMADSIKAAIERRLETVFVCLPGRVTLYDAATQKAEIQPLTKYSPPGQSPDLPPIISNVPVLFPRSTTAYFTFPLLPGDLVTLFFADKSLDKYLQLGIEYDPQDPRIHDLNDAFAFPGGYPFNLPVPDINVDKIRLGYNAGAVSANVLIDPITGSVSIETTGAINLGDDTATNVAIKDINGFIDTITDFMNNWSTRAASDNPPPVPPDPYSLENLRVILATYLSAIVRIG